MPQFCTGTGPEGGDRRRCSSRTTGRSSSSPQRSSPACASPTFEEVKLATELGPGAGVDAGGEAGPARLQGLRVAGVATCRHYPVVAALEDVDVVIRVCGAEGGVRGGPR